MAVNLAAPAALPPVAGVTLASTRAIKSKRRDDLTVVSLAAGSSVAGVFTRNRFPAPPVTLCRRRLRGGHSAAIRALAINAGIANAGTLGAGLKDAQDSCRLLAGMVGCRPTQVLPFSTGVIMERLPMQRYADGLTRCVAALAPDNWLAAAGAIMTTDTVAKGASARVGNITVTGIAKGAGMIHPNMATMLAFVATDARIPSPLLARWQKQIAADSFNAVSVDGDTSTNDSFLLIATGKAGAPAGKAQTTAVQNAIAEVCATLADTIVRDGEGATKLITIRVSGGKTHAVCRRVADSIARSPLVKTAFAAGDANVGRLLMAAGNAGSGFAPAAFDLHIGNVPVIRGGGLHPAYDEAKATALLAKAEVLLDIRLGDNNTNATVKTCDLTTAYIDINANYRS